MIKLLFTLFIIFIITISLTSCASMSNSSGSKPRGDIENEGGIVGSGNTINCEKQSNKNKSECINGIY